MKGNDIRENFQKGARGTFGETSDKRRRGRALRGNFQEKGILGAESFGGTAKKYRVETILVQ